ncbi:MAG: DMT family transporter [Candidatus Onthomonas sp.]|nr:DMT family transporter [Candidatus Onthomonas sp.]
MKPTGKAVGHLCAIFCIVVWGTTFIVSTMLLEHYTPIQTMFMRFIGAYAVLWCMYPKWHFHWRDEVGFLLMSLFSNTLYFMAENTALTLTQSSNVSILVSTAPVITALLLLFLPDGERVTRNIVAGIAIAFLGVILVVFNGSVVLKLNPAGDLIAIGAAVSWSIYSIILRRYSGRFSSYLLARKLMFYGILTTLPLLLIEHAPMDWSALLTPRLLLGLLFLTVVGSALCYVAWNTAVGVLGVLHTNIYIYAVPFVTMITAALCLHESITLMGVFGTILIISGMVISSLHQSE